MHLLVRKSRGLIVGFVLLALLGAFLPGAGIGVSHAVLVGIEPARTMGKGGSVEPVSRLSAPSEYAINFTETGLPAQTLWQVGTVTPLTEFVRTNSSNGTLVTQWWANGTYPFTATADLVNYTSAQVNASFTVSGGASTVPVQFFPAQPVTFTESGLSPSLRWAVSVQGNGADRNVTGVGQTIQLLVPVGPFNYTFYADGFNATPASGKGTVAATPLNIGVTFAVILLPVGYLAGVCTVGSAAMYIDGLRTNVNLGGGFSIPLEPGFHSIIVSATGFISFYDEVSIASGNTTNVYIALQGINDTYYNSTAVPGIDNTGWIIIGALAGGVVLLGIVAAVYAGRAKNAIRPETKPKP